jgi:hypothetical protein
MDTSNDTPQDNEDLYAFKLQVLHPSKAPYARYEIWKHRKGMESKLTSYLMELLMIEIAQAKTLSDRLLSGMAVVYPFPTRDHVTSGVVLVPNLDAHVVSHEEAGRT